MENMEQLIEMVENLADCAAQSETMFDDLATCYRKMYRSLMSKGFSRTDAMEILTSLKVGK